MFKTILMTAAAVLVATAAAAPAHAWIILNGGGANGLNLNGGGTNGYSTQGTSTDAARFAIDGIELPARAH